jgi:hypothetical protein
MFWSCALSHKPIRLAHLAASPELGVVAAGLRAVVFGIELPLAAPTGLGGEGRGASGGSGAGAQQAGTSRLQHSNFLQPGNVGNYDGFGGESRDYHSSRRWSETRRLL